MSTNPFEKKFTDDSFWKKVTKYAKSAGETALEPALKMYYAAIDADTPMWAKTTIYGALGYFISPIDAIPDITPIVGFTDDIGILCAALAATASHIKDTHVAEAKQKLKQWFS
ncbi:YkvA family protein [Pseudomonas saxonica]|uniref:DUF1232 domain-containing protein n=1 Tax=Pseudomonas saxonica TaxID=2600598 RepID=A0ABY3GDF3_9PSED|nr:YkvA family protein [Pseudomonas saxonica]TWR87106.1 DUF1232 domain-containing protein [Pseudomonas saxonica]WRQ76318.1 YkvA family protein [Pseudomonas saxonica]